MARAIQKAVGQVNYLIRMHDRQKKDRVFHVNMLQKWHTPTYGGFLNQEMSDDLEEDIPSWRDQTQSQATVGSQLSSTQVQELWDLLRQFDAVFQTLPGHTTLAEHRIQTENVAPVWQAPYRIPLAFRDTVYQELREMLEHDIIERSMSDWASPMVTVQKKDKSFRLCVRYRRLNILSNAYPIPRVDERVGNASFISTLDLTKGYWQVPSRV